jgi:hypothetical protein
MLYCVSLGNVAVLQSTGLAVLLVIVLYLWPCGDGRSAVGYKHLLDGSCDLHQLLAFQ